MAVGPRNSTIAARNKMIEPNPKVDSCGVVFTLAKKAKVKIAKPTTPKTFFGDFLAPGAADSAPPAGAECDAASSMSVTLAAELPTPRRSGDFRQFSAAWAMPAEPTPRGLPLTHPCVARSRAWLKLPRTH